MKYILIYFQLLCQVLLKLKESKISNLNVLLPISTQINVSYTLQAYNGCYQWISSNPEILSVNTLQNKETCQNLITVKVETNRPYHNMIWITAKDKNSGRVLSCEVRLATIKKLEILTKQKTVLVGDYETLELLGYDSKGNVFSTLEGLKFNWNIQQEQNYAEYQTFREANKKTTQKRHQLEQVGQQSDIIILKGHQTGQIEVSAFINDRIHDNAYTSQQLEIIEHFVVIPQNDLFVLPCDQIQFKLFLLHNNNQDIEIDRVILPNSDFQWKLDNDNIGQLGSDGNLIIGQQEGTSNIIIKDLRNKDNKISNTIQVVQPWRIKIFVTEYNNQMKDFLGDYKNKVLNPIEYLLSQFDNNWNFLKGKKYIIKAFIVDKNENLVTIQNYKINFKYSTSHFYNHNEENDSIILEAMTIGDTKLSVQMESHNCLHTFKETHQNLNIFSQIKIFKYIQGPIYLPYFKEQNLNQIYQLQAIGGSGKYDWFVENNNIATINNQDQLKSHQIGKTKVIVQDTLNNNNKDYLELVVTELKGQEFFEPKVEMLLDKQKDIFITAFDKQKHIYANCTDYQINLNQDKNFEIANTYSYQKMMDSIDNYLNKYQLLLPQLISFDFIQPSEYSEYIQNKVITQKQLKDLYKYYQNFGICQNIKVKPLHNTSNHLSFRSFNNQIRNLPIKIYKESSILYPEDFDQDIYGDKVMLTPDSQATFFIKDGNESWLEDIPINSRVLKKGDDFYDVKIGTRINGLLPVTIKCINLKKQQQKEGKFSVITSNRNDSQLYSPLEVISNIEFICALPKSIKIIPKEKKNQNPKTYLQNISNKVILKNNHKHEIITQMFNKEYVPFYNSTSIDQQWELNGYNNGELIKSSEQNKIILDLNDRIGDLELKVKARSNNDNQQSEIIEDSILIQSKKLLNIEPSYFVLYNHPDNQMDFQIQNGSGDFKISVNNETLVDYEFLPQQKVIRIKPKKKGQLILQVLDNNLTFQNIAESSIQIVNINEIKIDLPQKIVLKGEQVPINFILSSDNIKIPKDQIQFMDLKIQTPDDSLQIDNDKFLIQANTEGIYPITIKSNRDGIVSNSIDFQAFDHIYSFPSSVYLISGCTGYFQIQGGPNKSLRKQEGYEIQMLNPKQNIQIQQIGEDLYEIKANKPLEETIQINLISKKLRKEISSSQLKIYVGKIEDLTIRSSNIIHKGATTRLFAIPQIDYNNISISQCKLNYTVKNNSAGALSLNGLETINRQMSDLKQSILTIEIKGIKQGEGSIDIELNIEGQKTIKRQYYIQVEDSYHLPSSGFIGDDSCMGSFLLLKPNSIFQLPKYTSVYSQYQIIQHDGVSELINQNQIKTFSKLGNDFLQKKYSNQSQNEISLKVQNPYVLVAEKSKHLAFMNNLSRITVDLTYLDMFGRKFYKSIQRDRISVLVSNPDILSAFIDNVNQRLIIDTKSIGTTLIYIQDESQQHLFDLFQVSVGSLIAPEGTINILKGSQIRFMNLQKDQKNIWKSSNPEILKIDTRGHAIALKEGQAQVTFDEKLFLSQPINIQEITDLKPIEENPRIMTNIQSHQDYQTHYKFYFQAYGQDGKLELTINDLIQLYKDIQCKVDSSMFIAQKITDQVDKGLFGCQVTMQNNYQRLITTAQITILIFTEQNQISLSNQTENVAVLQSFVTQKDKNFILRLNKKDNKKKMIFYSGHELDVEVMQKLKPYVLTKYDNDKKRQGIQILIPSKVNNSFQSSFIVKSPKTHESVTYKVQYDHRSSFFSFLHLTNNNFGFMDFLILLCCIVFVGVLFYNRLFVNQKNKENTTSQINKGIKNQYLNQTYNNGSFNTDPMRRNIQNRTMQSHMYNNIYQLIQNINNIMDYLDIRFQDLQKEVKQIPKQTINFQEQTKMFYEIPVIKLRMIYDVVKNSQDQLDINEFPLILETFYQQIVMPFKNRSLKDSETQVILENLKCAYEKLKNNQDLINKKMVQDILYNDNYRLKIPTILFLENMDNDEFSLMEFYQFFNQIEINLIYDNQENKKDLRITVLQTQEKKQINNEENFEEIQTRTRKKTIKNFFGKFQDKLQKILNLGKFEGKQMAQAQQIQDDLNQNIMQEFDILNRQISSQLMKIQKIEKQNESQNFKIKELLYEVDIRDQQIQDLELKVINTRKDLNELLQKKQKEIDDINKEKIQIEDIFSELKKEHIEIKTLYEILKKEEDNLKEENADLIEIHNRKKKSYIRLESEQKKMEKEVQEKIKISKENKDLKLQLENVNKKLQNQQQENEKRLEELQILKDQLLQESEQQKKRLQQIQNQNNDHEQLDDNLFDSAICIEQTKNNDQYQTLKQQEQQQLISKIDLLEERLLEIEDEKKSLNKENEQLVSKQQEDQQEIEKLQNQKSQFIQQIQQLLSAKLQQSQLGKEQRQSTLDAQSESSFEVKIKKLIRDKKKLKGQLDQSNEELKRVENKLTQEMTKMSRMLENRADISKFELETLKLECENLHKQNKTLQDQIIEIEKKNKQLVKLQAMNSMQKFEMHDKKLTFQFTDNLDQSANQVFEKPQEQSQLKNINTRKRTINKINSILKHQKTIDDSQINNNEYISEVKQYSYDHLEVYKIQSMVNTIKIFQNVKQLKKCFSDIAYRVNSWQSKKKKWLVITERYMYEFSKPTKIKKAIKLRDIVKIKHSKMNNYVGIVTNKMEEEILETLKKEELILFLNRKIKKLGKNLLVQEKEQEEPKKVKGFFNPQNIKKFKPYFQETLRKASLDQNIEYLTIETKSFLGIDKKSEVLALLTNYGLLFFTIKDLKAVDFIPLVVENYILYFQ